MACCTLFSTFIKKFLYKFRRTGLIATDLLIEKYCVSIELYDWNSAEKLDDASIFRSTKILAVGVLFLEKRLRF